MKNKKIKRNSGFTLVETLFAVLILTFTITGLMTIVANSLFSARYAKDEITVNYLLQEVVDYVRNDRDTNFISGYDWATFTGHYDKCSSSFGGCSFDVSSSSFNTPKESCNDEPDGLCPILYYNEDPTTSFYNYTDTDKIKTNFRRIIMIDKNPLNPDELILKVEVKWKNGSISVPRSLSVSFLNWQSL